MSLLDFATVNTICKGYNYFKDGRVLQNLKISSVDYKGKVLGSNNAVYDVQINTVEPHKSICTCPIGINYAGRVVCKHQIAVYFSFFQNETIEWELLYSFINLLDKNNGDLPPVKIYNNRELMLKAITTKSIALTFASEELKNDYVMTQKLF